MKNKPTLIALLIVALSMICAAQTPISLSDFASDSILSLVTVAGTVSSPADESIDRYDSNDNLVSSETKLVKSKITNKTILDQMKENGTIPTIAGYSLVLIDGFCYAKSGTNLVDASISYDSGDGVFSSGETHKYNRDGDEVAANYKSAGLKSAAFAYNDIEASGLASFATISQTTLVDGDPLLWDAETFTADLSGTDDSSYAFVGTFKSASPKLVSELLP